MTLRDGYAAALRSREQRSLEIVQCDQPGWKTFLAHSTAANGLHGRLIVGTPVAMEEVQGLAELLPRIQLDLLKRKQTEAPPLAAGETWRTEIRGLPLRGMEVRFQ